MASVASNLHSKATIYARLEESQALNSEVTESIVSANKVDDRPGLLYVLPVSAKCADLLPKQEGTFVDLIIMEGLILSHMFCWKREMCTTLVGTHSYSRMVMSSTVR